MSDDLVKILDGNTFVVSDSKESATNVHVGPGFVGLSRSF